MLTNITARFSSDQAYLTFTDYHPAIIGPYDLQTLQTEFHPGFRADLKKGKYIWPHNLWLSMLQIDLIVSPVSQNKRSSTHQGILNFMVS